MCKKTWCFQTGRQHLFTFLVGALTVLFASSCSSSKETSYFKSLQKDTTLRGFVTDNFESKIRNGDNLSIIATSMSKDEDLLFNQAAGELMNVAGATSSGFLVQQDGTILLHRLGKVQAAGMTRKELALRLQKELAPYMKDPIVNVNYVNHKITIMGAVSRPQVINLPQEQMSLIDALVLSGDITPEGRKDDLMIIRENGDQKQVKHINLQDHSIFTSPWYYVQPNDIVYVMSDLERAERQEKRTALRTTLSLVTSAVTLLIIIIDRIIN